MTTQRKKLIAGYCKGEPITYLEGDDPIKWMNYYYDVFVDNQQCGGTEEMNDAKYCRSLFIAIREKEELERMALRQKTEEVNGNVLKVPVMDKASCDMLGMDDAGWVGLAYLFLRTLGIKEPSDRAVYLLDKAIKGLSDKENQELLAELKRLQIVTP